MGIRSPAGLAGKKIAVGLTHSISTLTIDEMLRADGVDPASVDYVPVPYPDIETGLRRGLVAAASLVEPFLSEAEISLGAEVIQPQCQGPTANLPLSGYFATAAGVTANLRTARAFARAIERGQALADEDRVAVEMILPSYIKVSRQTAAVVNLNTTHHAGPGADPARRGSDALRWAADQASARCPAAVPLNRVPAPGSVDGSSSRTNPGPLKGRPDACIR